jgi:hypothetical protein
MFIKIRTSTSHKAITNMSDITIADIRCIGKNLIKLYCFWTKDIIIGEQEKEEFSKARSMGEAICKILNGCNKAGYERSYKIDAIRKELSKNMEELYEKLDSLSLFGAGYSYKQKYFSGLYRLVRFHNAEQPPWRTYEDYYKEFITVILESGVPIVSVFLESVSPDYLVWDKMTVKWLLTGTQRGRFPTWLIEGIKNKVIETTV